MNNFYLCVLYIAEEEKRVRFESLSAIENIAVKTPVRLKPLPLFCLTIEQANMLLKIKKLYF